MTELEVRKQTLVDKLKSQSSNLIQKRQFDEICIILIDVSGSMNESCENGISKLENVKQSLPGLRPQKGCVSFGLIAFSDEGYPIMYPTTNFNRLLVEAQSLLVSGMTNIPSAIREGLKMMSDFLSSHHRLILMTDGSNNEETYNMEREIEHCISSHTIVDTIGFGKSADTTLLKSIAERTGGIFQTATSVMQLAESYRKLNFDIRYIEHKSN